MFFRPLVAVRYRFANMGGDLEFQRLFEAAPDVLLVLRPDSPRFTMVAATKARLEATMLSREQTLGFGLFEVFPDNPDDTSADGTSNLRASLERVLKTRAPDTMAVQKYDIRGPNGEFLVKYWSPKNIPVLSSEGEVDYILHRVEDVTELVQQSELGQELRDRTQAMEREVIKRSRELSEANRMLRDVNQKLGELDAAKTAFFSNVSHEFRTPLTLILGPIEEALASEACALSEDALRAAHRNALRLLRLVNSLLDFSRIEAGRLQLAFAPTDLSVVTGGLAGSFLSLMESAWLQLVIDCAPLPEPVYVDRDHWEKIVLNLISNAFKFTFEGKIEVRLTWHGSYVELQVCDTGVGIPDTELARIFERFHRVAGSRGRTFEGTGIGLALVKELTELHGGSVSVESKEGSGTRFVVRIPSGFAHLDPARVVAKPHPSKVETSGDSSAYVLATRELARGLELTPEDEAPMPPVEGGAEHLLLVEDNRDMREYLLRLLRPYWRVNAVRNGREALQAIHERRPTLVLSDVMMPIMSGAELLAALRADPNTNTIPVVLLSARAGEEAQLAGIDCGADDYVTKPFSARQLVSRVRTLLELVRTRNAANEATARLAETRATLVRELEAKNTRLHQAYEELQATQVQLVQSAKMASLGELVAGVAHEINNPLAFVLGHLNTAQKSLQVLRDSLPEPLPANGTAQLARADERLLGMHAGLTRIQDLVLKLRTFSRLDEGERKAASVKENVESVLTILAHRLRDRITVVTTYGEPDVIDCYPSLLNQGIMNLVSNAIDAIDGPGTIEITTGKRNGCYVVSVSDTGKGVPKELRERVFEPFFTTKPVGQGTGLGLSITYTIAQRHGGTLVLLPREGGGTCANLQLAI
jgi:signal transduction histidine kinase